MSKSSKNAERVALLNDYDSEEDDFFLKGPSSSKDKVIFFSFWVLNAVFNDNITPLKLRILHFDQLQISYNLV